MKERSGFTLVELSIVLVILGLLVGGVLTGQSLIRAAELRSVSTQYSRYTTAVMTFRDKYFALPGDMTNAAAYWGAADGAAGNNAACATTVGAGTQTCNGDGNGDIGFAPASNENFRLWQHLANAGLIEGNFNGVAWPAGAAYNVTANVNVPSGKFNNGIWTLRNLPNVPTNDAGRFSGNYANTFQYGQSNAGVWNDAPVFKPEDAYNVDLKMDDGKPATGFIVSNYSLGCTNAANATDFTATYTLSGTAVACQLHMFLSGSRSNL